MEIAALKKTYHVQRDATWCLSIRSSNECDDEHRNEHWWKTVGDNATLFRCSVEDAGHPRMRDFDFEGDDIRCLRYEDVLHRERPSKMYFQFIAVTERGKHIPRATAIDFWTH